MTYIVTMPSTGLAPALFYTGSEWVPHRAQAVRFETREDATEIAERYEAVVEEVP